MSGLKRRWRVTIPPVKTLLKRASFIGSEKWITVFARKENVGKENKSLIPLLFSFPTFSFPTFSFLASARETNRYLEYETCPQA
jgi:hypothetical protein